MMKYTKNKLCIKLVFLYRIASRFTANENIKFTILTLIYRTSEITAVRICFSN